MFIDFGVVGNAIAGFAEFIVAIASLVGILVVVLRKIVLKPLDNHIREMTKTIQPDSNGGKSLADVHRKIDAIHRRIDSIEERQIRYNAERKHIMERTEKQTRDWFFRLKEQGIDAPVPLKYDDIVNDEV